MWGDVKKIIYDRDEFLITTHLNPDGDGIGAACAMIELLLHLGKKVAFVCDDPIPRKFGFLDYHGLFQAYAIRKFDGEVQVLMMLDTHKLERIGRLAEIANRPSTTLICIDHHEIAEKAMPYAVIEPKACCVGEMVYSLYKEFGLNLNVRAATGIYVSVICDTGRFSYSSTSSKAHEIADECIRIGVDPDLIYSRIFQHVSLAEIKLFARTLQGIETYLNNKVIIEQILKEDCEKMGSIGIDLEHIDLDYIHDFNNLIEDVQCFVLLREINESHVRVSLRSKPELDISHIVHALGGGGHPHAAGVSWKGTVQEVKQRILELLEPVLKP